MIGLGFLIFFSLLMMRNNMTPDTGVEHLYWSLILRGIGWDYFLFLLLLYHYPLCQEKLVKGAAFTGMMRQLGGSFGIAIITTFITRFSQEHRVNLVAHLDGSKFEVQQRLLLLQKGFMSKGFTSNEALKKAYQLIIQ
jgi:DHA2 family multidrug resistance protein